METTQKVFIKTYGCQMNVYDSDRMWGLLSKEGYGQTQDPTDADVILINTCAIRDKAEQKVRSLLGSFRPLKQKKPKLVLGVTGCVGQRLGRSLLNKLPYVDLVMGPDQIDEVPKLIEDVVARGKRSVAVGFENSGRSYTQPAGDFSGRPSEYLTIIKGCDHFCSYCIVPFTRGREKSRPINEVVKDVSLAVSKGTKEIVFLGQNINTYGKGTGEDLAQLIEETNRIEGLERIRYITSHPYDLGENLIEQFGTVPKLCPQLHLPFQSGSNRVLKKMHRLYTREEYLGKINALRKACPEIALSTDVIVGFPGETEAEFEETLSLFEEIRFDTGFFFKYSERPGTRAHKEYPDMIEESVKEKRLARLLNSASIIFNEKNNDQVGKVVHVLVESMDKKGISYSGRTADFRLTHVLNAGPACVGKVIPVEITEANGTNLKGYYTDAERRVRTVPKAVSASL